jgi:hypothetical protein
METIGYSIDEFKGEYSVYCHKEDDQGYQDSCYEMAGTEKEVMQFLSTRGIDDQWFFGLQSYYDLRSN